MLNWIEWLSWGERNDGLLSITWLNNTFSNSSRSNTWYGRRRMLSVRRPPSSYPTYLIKKIGWKWSKSIAQGYYDEYTLTLGALRSILKQYVFQQIHSCRFLSWSWSHQRWIRLEPYTIPFCQRLDSSESWRKSHKHTKIISNNWRMGLRTCWTEEKETAFWAAPFT